MRQEGKLGGEQEEVKGVIMALQEKDAEGAPDAEGGGQHLSSGDEEKQRHSGGRSQNLAMDQILEGKRKGGVRDNSQVPGKSDTFPICPLHFYSQLIKEIESRQPRGETIAALMLFWGSKTWRQKSFNVLHKKW